MAREPIVLELVSTQASPADASPQAAQAETPPEIVSHTAADQPRSAPGEGEVLRPSKANRMAMACLYGVGGLVGAFACILIPIVHLVTTWALPIAGIYLAMRTLKREVLVYDIEATCPNCGRPITLAGGATNEPTWQACPECQAPLRVKATVSAVPLSTHATSD